eukprot:CAMPEP_0113965818 /NCGR_PEP_ID=MMETSP0011_2-20120614/7968_1 /TAXON_ID=101924 /ORGANISM="Rhodosorus marinus" /LENGTH=350 /DNA_ID=CAMNT_0000978397 /DNA_START=1041 /DNA_END=2093 /DNA_ORIENTATION=+ /assembly_acc=CAM_ASM_000156
MVMNQVIVRLAQRPRGEIVIGEHLVVDRDVPVREQLEDGELLIQVMWLSVDPAMRGWMSSAKSYLPPSPLGEPMRANGVGRVTRSKSDKYDVGTVVSGFLGMQEYAILPEKKIRKVVLPKGVSPRLALGVLGNNGLTAYFGLFEVGHPKPGDTVVVSAAAGATGSIAAQITKSVLGCRTIGIAGGEEKRLWLSNEISLDDAIDYKNDDIGKSLKRTCPDGIDVYFDNVGGVTLNEVLKQLNRGGRVVLCGAISSYNTPGSPGPSNYVNLIPTRSKMEGFIVLDYVKQYPKALADLTCWLQEGKIKYEEDIVDGIANAPEALLRLFKGQNLGKVVVRVAGDGDLRAYRSSL